MGKNSSKLLITGRKCQQKAEKQRKLVENGKKTENGKKQSKIARSNQKY